MPKDIRPLAAGRVSTMQIEETPTEKNAKSIEFVFFAPRDVLIPRVDRVCIMRFCEAMVRRGLIVEVVSLNVRIDFEEPTLRQGLFEVYGIRVPFQVTILPSRASQNGRDLHPMWRALAYTFYATRHLLRRRRKGRAERLMVFYVKNYLPGLLLRWVCTIVDPRTLVVFEAHVPPANRTQMAILRRMDGIVTVSSILERELTANFGFESQRVIVAHMGVDLDGLEQARVSKAEARRHTELPMDRSLVVYTGKVIKNSREIELLVEASKLLPQDVELIIVGGREDLVRQWRHRVSEAKLANVRFVGFVAPSVVPFYQLASDVLVSYYPSELAINAYRASPGKFFEYMWALRPIVTADYPALREILGPDSAVFLEPDNPAILAQEIMRVLEDNHLATRVADHAFRDVQRFSWADRAERVERFLRGLDELHRNGQR